MKEVIENDKVIKLITDDGMSIEVGTGFANDPNYFHFYFKVPNVHPLLPTFESSIFMAAVIEQTKYGHYVRFSGSPNDLTEADKIWDRLDFYTNDETSAEKIEQIRLAILERAKALGRLNALYMIGRMHKHFMDQAAKEGYNKAVKVLETHKKNRDFKKVDIEELVELLENHEKYEEPVEKTDEEE